MRLSTMRRLALFFFSLSAAACHPLPADKQQMRPPPAAYVRFEDRLAARMLNWGVPWRLPCTRSVRDKGIRTVSSLPDDQCVKFDPPRRWRGLWRNDFEGSQFCAAPADRCAVPDIEAKMPHVTWFEPPPGFPGLKDTPPGGLYAVDLVGRRSTYRGFHGHLGMFDQEVIADRMLSIRLVEAPRRGQMTAEHVASYLKDCDGRQVCMPNSEVQAVR